MKMAQGRFKFQALILAVFNPPGHVKWVPCHNGLARPQVAGEGDILQILRVAANTLVLNKQSRTVDKELSSSSGVGRGTNSSSPYKNKLVTKCHKGPRTWTDSLNLAQDRDQWEALVNTVMNLRIS
jgi:hypothetical protein